MVEVQFSQGEEGLTSQVFLPGHLESNRSHWDVPSQAELVDTAELDHQESGVFRSAKMIEGKLEALPHRSVVTHGDEKREAAPPIEGTLAENRGGDPFWQSPRGGRAPAYDGKIHRRFQRPAFEQRTVDVKMNRANMWAPGLSANLNKLIQSTEGVVEVNRDLI